MQPAAVAEDPAELGVQDLILVSVKYAQLETAAAQLAPIVGPDTLVLPVMNGVHTAAKLGRLLGKGRMLQSVIYVVSSAGEDYSITQYGDYTTIYLGAGERAGEADAKAVCEALKAADIDCRFAPDVQAAIWSKYVLNCAYNVVTARWGRAHWGGEAPARTGRRLPGPDGRNRAHCRRRGREAARRPGGAASGPAGPHHR